MYSNSTLFETMHAVAYMYTDLIGDGANYDKSDLLQKKLRSTTSPTPTKK